MSDVNRVPLVVLMVRGKRTEIQVDTLHEVVDQAASFILEVARGDAEVRVSFDCEESGRRSSSAFTDLRSPRFKREVEREIAGLIA